MHNRNVILISGGSMVNKGAQAMVFVAVAELSKRYPGKEIVMLSYNENDLSGGAQYTFAMRRCSNEIIKHTAGGLFRVMANKADPAEVQSFADFLQRCCLIVDVSGYGLSSNWSIYAVMSYLAILKCARRFSIPAYLMPQSFGPLCYGGKKGFLYNLLAKAEARRCLNYAEIVFVREKSGQAFLRDELGLKHNVRLANDMVLAAAPYDIDDVVKNCEEPAFPDKYRGAVALIPNIRTFLKKDRSEIVQLYEVIIGWILREGKQVLLMTHSEEDAPLVSELKGRFADNADVVACFSELPCYAMQKLVAGLEMVITSRYHSVVHAYKAGTPCIVFGWADKYGELMTLFQQQRFLFDVSGRISQEDVLEKLDEMFRCREAEAKTIADVYAALPKGTLFDAVRLPDAVHGVS